MKRNYWWWNRLKLFCVYCRIEQMSKYIGVWGGAQSSNGRRVVKKYGKGEGELCCIGLELEVQTHDFIKIYIFLLGTKKVLRTITLK